MALPNAQPIVARKRQPRPFPGLNPVVDPTFTQKPAFGGTIPGVVRKGASIPYTSMNGTMFSYLFDEGSLPLRLSARDREAFTTRFGTGLQ